MLEAITLLWPHSKWGLDQHFKEITLNKQDSKLHQVCDDFQMSTQQSWKCLPAIEYFFYDLSVRFKGRTFIKHVKTKTSVPNEQARSAGKVKEKLRRNREK
jgi:hypothetical protein